MKLRSFIMFSAAALAFAACSNEEDFGTSAAIEGEATIRVNIAEPALSRVIPVADYTTSEEVDLNSIKLVLTAQQGGAEKVFNFADFAEEENPRQAMLEAVKEFEFTGVTRQRWRSLSILKSPAVGRLKILLMQVWQNPCMIRKWAQIL